MVVPKDSCWHPKSHYLKAGIQDMGLGYEEPLGLEVNTSCFSLCNVSLHWITAHGTPKGTWATRMFLSAIPGAIFTFKTFHGLELGNLQNHL